MGSTDLPEAPADAVAVVALLVHVVAWGAVCGPKWWAPVVTHSWFLASGAYLFAWPRFRAESEDLAHTWALVAAALVGLASVLLYCCCTGCAPRRWLWQAWATLQASWFGPGLAAVWWEQMSVRQWAEGSPTVTWWAVAGVAGTVRGLAVLWWWRHHVAFLERLEAAGEDDDDSES